MQRWKPVLCVCFFFLLVHGLHAQEKADSLFLKDSKPLYAGLRGHLGFVFLHTQELQPIGSSNPWGMEADVGLHFITQKAWAFCNCYPRAGVALTYWDFDNANVLGQGVTVVSYLEPVYLTKFPVNLSFRVGLGLSYQNSPYDSASNPLNLAYSTRVAFPLMVNAGLNYRISPRWNLRVAAAYNHISNGGIRLPNKGINYPTLNLGLDHSFQPAVFPGREKVRGRKMAQKNRFALAGYFSGKNADPRDPQQFAIFGLGLTYSRWLKGVSAISAGFDWFEDWSRKERIRQEVEQGLREPTNHTRYGIRVGHEFWLGRVVFSQSVGVYLYDKFPVNERFYQKFELMIRATPWMFAGLGLKTHRQVADFLDARLVFFLQR